jgi:hypothetical protein
MMPTTRSILGRICDPPPRPKAAGEQFLDNP